MRRHLSGLKGGGLPKRRSRPVFGTVLSDVPGDDLATIGSPFAPDYPLTWTLSVYWLVTESGTLFNGAVILSRTCRKAS